MEDKHGNPVDVAPGSGYQVRIKVPVDINPDFGLLIADIKAWISFIRLSFLLIQN